MFDVRRAFELAHQTSMLLIMPVLTKILMITQTQIIITDVEDKVAKAAQSTKLPTSI